jgi:predicted nuclease with TOPRIM domain
MSALFLSQKGRGSVKTMISALNSHTKSGKSILALTIALASIIFAALLTAYTYQLHVNYASLKAENERLSEHCALLTSERLKLVEALESLNKTLLILSESYTILSEDYQALNESYQLLKANYALLSEKYKALNESYATLNENYAKLSEDHKALEKSYTELRLKYEVLEKEHDYLASRSSTLARENAALKAENELFSKICSKLNETLTKVLETANSYSTFTTSLPRVLSGEEMEALSSTVNALGLSTDLWSSIKRIYDYVTTTIKYADDVALPRFQVVMTIRVGDKAYAYEVGWDEVQECVQAPTLTLKLKRGDCEDQSVLAHALLQAYTKKVLGRDLVLYQALVFFKSGNAHACTILNAGGKICIIDPAGHYLTSDGGKATAKPTLDELRNYSGHWSSEGGIEYLELWSVVSGKAIPVIKGTIEHVARALGS